MRPCVVITTIHAPSAPVRKHCAEGMRKGYDVVVVGDSKTPETSYRELARSTPNLRFLGLSEQTALASHLAQLVAHDHYARKNLGYLFAMREGYQVIAETDDDTEPYEHWGPRSMELDDGMVVHVRPSPSTPPPAFFNVYRCYSRTGVWPRGFPLG